jgi:hypothetical protein
LPARIRETAKPEIEMKKTRYKDSDLALIVHDIPECSDNIGHCWLIEPIAQNLYAVERRGVVSRTIAVFCVLIEHPDDWLLPMGRKPAGQEATSRTLLPEGPRSEQRVAAVAFGVES